MDIIIFHANSPDGWCGAYIGKIRYPEAVLEPRDHGIPIDVESYRDKDVICVDCNLRGKNDEVYAIAKSYHVYDHHKSETDIIGKPYVTYDVNRSGAGLAWDYLFGKDAPADEWLDKEPREVGKPRRWSPNFHAQDGSMVPINPRRWWVNYVEDRDLWNFKLPMSRAINAYIMTFPYEMESWKKMTDSNFLYAATAGEAILLQIDKYVREAVKQAQAGTVIVGGKRYTVGVVNTLYLNTSEVGAELATHYDIGLGWFERRDGMIQFSARSRGDIRCLASLKDIRRRRAPACRWLPTAGYQGPPVDRHDPGPVIGSVSLSLQVRK